MTTDLPERLGLRERKKLRAMQQIQWAALDLFDQHGYDAVTIERIAAAAEVSPSSVYRYFGTKERLILHDEYDPALLREMEIELDEHDFMTAVRRALASTMQTLVQGDHEFNQRRMRYVVHEPAVRARMQQDMDEMNAVIAEMLARHTGHDPADLEIRVAVGALVSSFVAAVYYWVDHPELALSDVVEQTLDLIEQGFDLRSI
ncbi:MAG TPA: TetR family transcriptional regulator [Jiangellaceae bacterium]|nr:TetR family transcriptional regulator [Jiangellaceae bacterium]